MAEGRTQVAAEFQERKRIVFTARERSSVNVRVESADGGPVGYTSYEMLLMALANCTLGVVMGHESLADLPVTGCRAVIEATSARAPSRVDSITVRVELDVEGGDERLRQTLARVADSCPVGNTLKNPPQINVQLVVNDVRQPVAAGTTAG
ncbi:MAG: OsmC family protein [Dehalococcoidia bacterium]